MNPILKNALAIIVGWLAGSVVNMGLIQAGNALIPMKGIDPGDMNALAAIMPTLEFKHFIFPFLAHAIGTLVGATVAGLLATKYKIKFSLAIGILFLLGGIMINYMLPGPIWFVTSDIIVAYIPMAWIGGKIAVNISFK